MRIPACNQHDEGGTNATDREQINDFAGPSFARR